MFLWACFFQTWDHKEPTFGFGKPPTFKKKVERKSVFKRWKGNNFGGINLSSGQSSDDKESALPIAFNDELFPHAA